MMRALDRQHARDPDAPEKPRLVCKDPPQGPRIRTQKSWLTESDRVDIVGRSNRTRIPGHRRSFPRSHWPIADRESSLAAEPITD